MAFLKPLWLAKPETVARLRGRIDASSTPRGSKASEAAKLRALARPPQPNHAAPQAERCAGQHYPAMRYDAVPDFTVGLKHRVSTAARALEFLILTAAPIGQAIGATWSEVDVEAATWTIPEEAGRKHVVPLLEAALVVLRTLAVFGTKPDAPIFPSRDGGPLCNMASTA